MAKCWERRGCDDDMQSHCAHATEFKDNCPTKCVFANCDRSTHEISMDPEKIFSVTVDRQAAIRDICTLCEFFLTNGPKVA